MSDAEWGPWIEHDGKGCPVLDGVICHRILSEPARGDDVRALGKDEDISPVDRAWEWRAWEWEPDAVWVLRYRIRKPRGLTILENLIADLPAPAHPKVDA